MTHVDIQPDLLPLLGRVDNVLDGITGFVEHYDFSRANSSYEARVQAITKVASICYASPKALGSISLFNRLQAESGGLPSSSYEFIPILISSSSFDNSILSSGLDMKHCEKFGEWVQHPITTDKYLLTNLRALLEDVGEEASLVYFNTDPLEQQIIRDNFKVFLFNVDLSTRAQMVRHRVSWQELSRRYVSGKKKRFEFYISKKMAELKDFLDEPKNSEDDTQAAFETKELIEICVLHYDNAIAKGVKPEEARRILPQAMMTQIWGAFQPNQLSSYFKLRLDKSAQSEIRDVSAAMKGLIDA